MDEDPPFFATGRLQSPHRLLKAPPPATGRGRSSGVEHNLAKVGVEGSNPFARSSRVLSSDEPEPPGGLPPCMLPRGCDCCRFMDTTVSLKSGLLGFIADPIAAASCRSHCRTKTVAVRPYLGGRNGKGSVAPDRGWTWIRPDPSAMCF